MGFLKVVVPPPPGPPTPVTPIEFKSTTPAGGLRDITKEAVRTDAGGSGMDSTGLSVNLDTFFPKYLRKK